MTYLCPIETMLHEVSARRGVTVDDILGDARGHHLSEARAEIAWRLHKKHYQRSDIARILNKSDRAIGKSLISSREKARHVSSLMYRDRLRQKMQAIHEEAVARQDIEDEEEARRAELATQAQRAALEMARPNLSYLSLGRARVIVWSAPERDLPTFGDPVPGRSALDMRIAESSPDFSALPQEGEGKVSQNTSRAAEEWRPIPSFPGYYASSLGRIRGRRGKVLLPSPNERGYLQLKVCRDGKIFSRRVHSLVCEAFHGPMPPWATLTAHGDGNLTNNCERNLRWATHADNSADMAEHGTRLTGENHPRATLSRTQVDEIRREHAASMGASYAKRGIRRTLASKYGVSIHVIKDIIGGRSWV